MEVIDTGHPMTVPVGSFVLGRIFNVLGIPMDQSVGNDDIGVAIHRAGPVFVEGLLMHLLVLLIVLYS